jgi:hypothetical protein
MPFDVTHLGIALENLTWLEDHERFVDPEDAYDDGHDQAQQHGRGLQRAANDKDLQNEPLQTLLRLNDDDIRSLSLELRQQVEERLHELQEGDSGIPPHLQSTGSYLHAVQGAVADESGPGHIIQRTEF